MARFNRAEPIEKGQVELTLAPALAGPSDGFEVETEGEPYVGSEQGINWFPSLDLEARYGFGERVDGAVTLRNMGTTLGADLKLALARGRVGAVAFDPAVQVGLDGSYLGIEAPLLFDVKASRIVTLTLALQYTGLWVVGVGFDHLVGGTFGVEVVVTNFLRVQPYVSVFVWLDPPDPAYTARYFSGGLAFKLPLRRLRATAQ
ncbi:MAG: hypothetical protein R3F39_25050 [Myxococcota bacterium]